LIDILCGDVREVLATLPDQSVQCCVTSPPYWGLRDYGMPGQIGLEKSPQEYVDTIVGVFRAVHRVLKDDGTLWLNLGDSYAANRSYQVPSTKGGAKHSPAQGALGASVVPDGLKPKDLVGIPWRVAFALQADGWYLRSDIVWCKPNAMPESVQDRPTRAHEYIFLLTKSERYYYDSVAIRTPYAESTQKQFDKPYTGEGTKDYSAAGVQNPSDVKRRIVDKQRGHSRKHAGFNDHWDAMSKSEQQSAGANKRTVWTVATRPFKGAHFATFPQALIEPCILAGSRAGDTVLDPFGGSGTTGVAAAAHGRNATLIELNPDYLGMIMERVA